MASKIFFAMVFSIVGLFVINACSSSSPPPTPSPTDTPLPTATLVPSPTSDPLPTATPTPEPTPEPTPAQQSRGLFEYTRAVSLLQANLWEDAIPAFGLLVRILPDFAQGYHGRGVAYYNESLKDENDNLFEPALEDLDKAIELKPDFAEAYKDRALLLRDMGDNEKALSDMEKAVSFYDPLRQPNALAAARILLDEFR